MGLGDRKTLAFANTVYPPPSNLFFLGEMHPLGIRAAVRARNNIRDQGASSRVR